VDVQRPASTFTEIGLLQEAPAAESDSDEGPSKRVKNAGVDITPQQSVAGAIRREPEPAASAAPFRGGGFGALASKGSGGFAFGGQSTVANSGFGSVAFGGGAVFGASTAAPAGAAAAAPSFASKASKDGAASPSDASNAGSAAAVGFGSQVFGAAVSDAATAADRTPAAFADVERQAVAQQPAQVFGGVAGVYSHPVALPMYVTRAHGCPGYHARAKLSHDCWRK
jgi:hypothetical protein